MKPRGEPDAANATKPPQRERLPSPRPRDRALADPPVSLEQSPDGAIARTRSASDASASARHEPVEAAEEPTEPNSATESAVHRTEWLKSRDESSGKKDYKVGYKKPPLHTRWTPEHCPNPKGRPRGSKDTVTLVTAAMNTRVAVTQAGRRRMISKRELAVIKIVNRMTEKSDINALLKLTALEISHARALGPGERPDHAGAKSGEELSRSDRDILRWYLDRAGGSDASPRSDNDDDATGGEA